MATLAPPATGKMVKGLIMCCIVIFLTFYSTAVSGYWVFGNKSNSNIIQSLMPDEGPALAPVWVLGLAIVFVLLQLFAIGLEVLANEKAQSSSSVNQEVDLDDLMDIQKAIFANLGELFTSPAGGIFWNRGDCTHREDTCVCSKGSSRVLCSFG